MRRLLGALVCLGPLLGLAAAPALTAAAPAQTAAAPARSGAAVARRSAGAARATGRVPAGVERISVTLTSEPTSSSARPAEHRTFTKAASIAKIVKATDALPTARRRGVCPMIMRLGPDLTVVFLNAKGRALAEATVQVVDGSRGDSGSTACFPIRFTSGGQGQSLVGNGFIRMMGRMLGTAIS